MAREGDQDAVDGAGVRIGDANETMTMGMVFQCGIGSVRRGKPLERLLSRWTELVRSLPVHPWRSEISLPTSLPLAGLLTPLILLTVLYL